MYYPPFEAAIKADVGIAMCSYNDENHIPTCGNDEILNRDLRHIMGFKGFVMSDWDATYSGPKDYVKQGCDQEQSDEGVKYYSEKALKQEVDQRDIDRAVYRIAKTFIKYGLFEK